MITEQTILRLIGIPGDLVRMESVRFLLMEQRFQELKKIMKNINLLMFKKLKLFSGASYDVFEFEKYF